MTMLAEQKTGAIMTLADYEARIHIYREQIGTGYIGIGRTLNEAKAARVVPHGEWESWVTRTTGLSPRQAQRCMQAAEEIRDGSALARLEMSKALLLLSSGLEQDQQEALAAKAEEEGTGVRGLKDEIRKLKLQIVQETGAATEMRQALKAAQEERDSVTAQMRFHLRQHREQLEAETGRAYQRGRQDTETEIYAEARKEFQQKLDYLNGQRNIAEENRKAAVRQLQEVQQAAGQKWDEGFEAGSKELGKARADLEDIRLQLEDARADLAAAEARELRRADELEALRREQQLQALADARTGGRPAEGPDLAAAVRQFIGAVGVLPQMAATLQRMSREQLDGIREHVETVAAWVEGARAALGTIHSTDSTVM